MANNDYAAQPFAGILEECQDPVKLDSVNAGRMANGLRQLKAVRRLLQDTRDELVMTGKVRILVTVIAIVIGAYAVYLGGMHGYYEISNVETRPGGIIFDAISGNSLAVDFPGWPGWPAMSLIPDLTVTGLMVFAICGLMLLWLLVFTNHAKWGQVLAVLAIVLCLFGGGFKPPFLVIVAAIIGTAIRQRNAISNL